MRLHPNVTVIGESLGLAASKDTYGRWTTHELGKLGCDLWRVHDLLNTPTIVKLRVWIVHRMLVVL